MGPIDTGLEEAALGQIEQVYRVFDRKPWAVHLFVTDRCNLSCDYCNEYDNSRPHPKTEDLKEWMRKARELGCARIGFMGGEPLLHPDIGELVRYAKQLGYYKTSMSTNAFPLTRELVDELSKAGLDTLQFSIDRMTPTEKTRKALKSVGHKLRWFDGLRTRVNVNSVLFGDTINEAMQVIDYCLDQGVATQARIIHDDLIGDIERRDEPLSRALLEVIEYQEKLKLNGAKIHTDWSILDFQKAVLRGESPRWKCVAGYKYFLISGAGKFWPCSQVRTDKHIMEVTRDDLLAYDDVKPCQSRCGVYCTIDMSFKVNRTAHYVQRDARRMLRRALSKLRPNRPLRLSDSRLAGDVVGRAQLSGDDGAGDEAASAREGRQPGG